VNWVVSLPIAFWTMMSELDSPASVNAFVMYGASNSTYRVEVTVSGRIAATLPFPAEASGFRLDMALRSAENCDDEIVGAEDADEDVVEVVVALELELALEDELLLLLPQPAATAATTNVSTDTRNQREFITARSSHMRARPTLLTTHAGQPGREHTVKRRPPSPPSLTDHKHAGE
jgi:hypothetical protein